MYTDDKNKKKSVDPEKLQHSEFMTFVKEGELEPGKPWLDVDLPDQRKLDLEDEE